MIAILAWVALSIVVAYVVGGIVRDGAADAPAACNQNCRQGRDCSCTVPVDGETPP